MVTFDIRFPCHIQKVFIAFWKGFKFLSLCAQFQANK